jgi:hypothetical protein
LLITTGVLAVQHARISVPVLVISKYKYNRDRGRILKSRWQTTGLLLLNLKGSNHQVSWQCPETPERNTFVLYTTKKGRYGGYLPTRLAIFPTGLFRGFSFQGYVNSKFIVRAYTVFRDWRKIVVVIALIDSSDSYSVSFTRTCLSQYL